MGFIFNRKDSPCDIAIGKNGTRLSRICLLTIGHVPYWDTVFV
jgi:hypothetical protein